MPVVAKKIEDNLAVKTYENYEEAESELYRQIQKGIDDIENGKTLTEDEILKNMEMALNN